jgi:ribosomal protein S18 acetylase RimI-like enzyme
MIDSNNVQVRQASVTDLDSLALLFDGYRQFYGKPSDLPLARSFLLERFKYNQSILFIATQPDVAAIGFTQLYPSFSSVSAGRIFVLNDIFVVPAARRSGVALKLLNASVEFARAVGAIRLSLITAVENEAAQAMYASQGWVRDTKFYAYNLSL